MKVYAHFIFLPVNTTRTVLFIRREEQLLFDDTIEIKRVPTEENSV